MVGGSLAHGRLTGVFKGIWISSSPRMYRLFGKPVGIITATLQAFEGVPGNAGLVLRLYYPYGLCLFSGRFGDIPCGG